MNNYNAYYVFRGNAPNDPDLTGAGVQPYGWDQLMNDIMFVQYRCPASAISVYFQPDADNVKVIHRLHAFVTPFRDDNPVLSDISDVRMIPGHKETTYDATQEGTKGCKIKNYATTRRLFTEISTNEYNFTGQYNASPTFQWFWLVHFILDQGAASDLPVIYFDVKIKYYVKASRYNPPNES